MASCCHVALKLFVNIGSVPDGTEPLCELMFTYCQGCVWIKSWTLIAFVSWNMYHWKWCFFFKMANILTWVHWVKKPEGDFNIMSPSNQCRKSCNEISPITIFSLWWEFLYLERWNQNTFIRWHYNSRHGADIMLWHWDVTLRLSSFAV